MAYAAGQGTMTGDKKLIDPLIADLITLSYECKRKYPPIKEAAEACQLKVRGIGAKSENVVHGLIAASPDILQPFILGCDTKNPKVVQMSLTAIQRQISQQTINMAAAENIVNALWLLMEAGVEELKLLQTAILLITTTSVVQHETLARALVLCFRLHFAKDSTTTNTAAATIRQLVSVIFERVISEDATSSTVTAESVSMDELKAAGKQPPKSLRSSASDAYLLFQDFCLLLNADQPQWLLGMTEMTRTLCLELMEEVLSNFNSVFIKHPEFSFLLSEKVCPLVIKLFSPSLKYRSSRATVSPSPVQVEKPYFPIVMRLLRIVAVLIRYYYNLLITECEIFLSLLVKFLDPEKPMWQRATALEVLCKLCLQPQLVRSFCESYDMKPHSTKIFRDIVNGLGAFIQSQFMNSSPSVPSTGSKLPETMVIPQTIASGGVQVVGGYSPQPAFCYRNVWIPLVINFTAIQTSHKAIYLEMLDKSEPPTVPDGYGMSLAFLCLLDVVKSIQGLVQTPTAGLLSAAPADTEPVHGEVQLKEELINSSWCGVLAAMSLLLDASTDESATEATLKSLQAYASMCGQMELNTPRDAFITAVCKASLPAHYALQILNSQISSESKGPQGRGLNQMELGSLPGASHSDSVQGSQVVAVGTPLATSSLPSGTHQGPVMLTAKNIQCMRALLNLAHCHGGVLGTAWHQVLTTLQHLVWILGLKPSSGGTFKPTQVASENPNAVITTSIMSDLPVLSAMLSRLFESSQYLDDVALHHLIDALCKLSSEAMDVGFSNREPSLFAVAKLLETGVVNLPRVEVLWRPVTGHLLEFGDQEAREKTDHLPLLAKAKDIDVAITTSTSKGSLKVCQHPHQGLRTWAAEAVTSLIKAALFFKYDPPLHLQPKLQAKLLCPLQELSSSTHADVRQKQLDCVLLILQNNGEQLNEGWPLVLGVIGAITNNQGESLIRAAFQSLQLVVTDFLPSMSCSCLQICIEVAAKFGLQHQELNISLTAVGLLWNIADHISQNRISICESLAKESDGSGDTKKNSDQTPSTGGKTSELAPSGKLSELPAFDSLWMVLYTRLGDLCVDQRPAVRKSAGQTLFSMIAAHGSLLQQQTWHTVLWKVLFPLLDRVKHLSSTASDSKEDAAVKSGNILMHHSRDTAEKQWAETRFLTLAGVARVFNMKRRVLQQLGDFLRAWALLLEFIESSALCPNAEVSLAALKSFQEILNINKGNGDTKSEELKMLFNKQKSSDTESSQQNDFASNTDRENPDDLGIDDTTLWSNAWRVWRSIGTAATNPPETNDRTQLYIPSQAFLTALVQTFPALYAHIKNQFVAAELQKLFIVLQRALCVPIHSSSTPFIVPLGEISSLTPLQEAILDAIRILGKDALSGSDNMAVMYPEMFDRLLAFIEFAVHPPKFGKVDTRSLSTVRNNQTDWVAMNYVPFAEAIIDLIVELYQATAKYPSVVQNRVLQNIVKAFRLPLGLKYSCPSQSTWLLTINALLKVLAVGLPVAKKNESAFHGMWLELGCTLEDFLFSQHPLMNSSTDDFQRDEAIDCRVIQLIRDEILPSSKKLPHEFIVKIMSILNKGSIHSVTSSSFIDIESSHKLREEFAKACFETLLQFSFISPPNGDGTLEEGAITHLAIESLLSRCKTVLQKFINDERLSGKCPLPSRPRMTEMSFVLKAVSTLVFTLKKTATAVDRNIWKQVIDLYPALVDCTTSSSANVGKALKEALMEYGDLLAPPVGEINGTVK